MLIQELIKIFLLTAEKLCFRVTDKQMFTIVTKIKNNLTGNGLQENISPAIIDMGNVEIKKMIFDLKRKEILEKYGSSITWEESRHSWRLRLRMQDGKLQQARRIDAKKSELEDMLVEYYITKERSEEGKQEAQQHFTQNSLAVLYQDFMAYKKTQVSTSTITRMAADWKRFYAEETDFISKSYKLLTAIDIRIFFGQLLDKHYIKRRCFNNATGILKQMLEFAVERGDIHASPYPSSLRFQSRKFKPDDNRTEDTEVYNKDDRAILCAEMLRRFANNPINTAPLAPLLAFELGTRKGEELAIDERDIDMEARTVFLHRQVVVKFNVNDLEHCSKNGLEIIEHAKKGSDRTICLTDRAMELIHMIRNTKKEYGLSYQHLLFVSPDNGIMKLNAVDAQMKRGCEYAGLPLRTMHKIRKSVASDLFDAGVSLTDIAGLLGHSTIQTTINHYIFNTKSREESARRVAMVQEMIRNGNADTEGSLAKKLPDLKNNPETPVFRVF